MITLDCNQKRAIIKLPKDTFEDILNNFSEYDDSIESKLGHYDYIKEDINIILGKLNDKIILPHSNDEYKKLKVYLGDKLYRFITNLHGDLTYSI